MRFPHLKVTGGLQRDTAFETGTATQMLNVPNALTFLRFALIAPLAWLLHSHAYDVALVLFIVSALSDWADGVIARRWNQRTRAGAIADPVADKLTMLTATLSLALQGWLPWWFALVAVARDFLIVAGVAAFHLLIGRMEIAPSRLSKLNTALEFVLLASLMAIAAGRIEGGAWWWALLGTTFATIASSGIHYAWIGGRRIAEALRRRK